MKRIKSLQIGFLAAMLFVSSCKQDVLAPDTTTPTSVAEVETTPEDISSEDAKRARVDATAAVSYTVSPAQNTFTACSSGAQSPTCATFQAGLRAFVKNVNGNKITVQIQRCDGKPFGSGGTGYIKPTNLCGGPNSLIAGNSSWTRTDFYFIDVDFWAIFNSGTVAFYPTITLNNGTRMYSNPISVIAKDDVLLALNTQLTASKQGGLSAGTVYGYVNNVAVYSNGTTPYLLSRGRNQEGTMYYGEKWQCVEFMRRFYYKAFGFHIKETRDYAKQFYNSVSGLKSYANGSSTAPQPGDILCITSTGAGHVAIITEVGANYVKVAHQNVGGLTHIGLSLSKSGNTVSASAIGSGYTVQGWMRR